MPPEKLSFEDVSKHAFQRALCFGIVLELRDEINSLFICRLGYEAGASSCAAQSKNGCFGGSSKLID